MKHLLLKTQINLYFVKILFGKQKKVAIFAFAFPKGMLYWRNGRAVECGSLENC